MDHAFGLPGQILLHYSTRSGLLFRIMEHGSSGFLVGGTGHERASKRPHLRTVDRWNADWGALALMVERWLVPLIPFPSYKLCASDRPGAVKGARFARRSEPLTARTDLESYEGEGKGILQPSSHLPTKNPEYPGTQEVFMRLVTNLLAAVVVALVPAGLMAQGTTTISGVVTDASGGVVVGASVTVTNVLTNAERSATTNELGFYTVGSLQPGEYSVDVQAPGFQRLTQSGVTVEIDRRIRVDASLQVGQVTEVVERRDCHRDAVIKEVVDQRHCRCWCPVCSTVLDREITHRMQ